MSIFDNLNATTYIPIEIHMVIWRTLGWWYLANLIYHTDEKKDVFLLDGYIFSGLSDELKQQIIVSSTAYWESEYHASSFSLSLITTYLVYARLLHLGDRTYQKELESFSIVSQKMCKFLCQYFHLLLYLMMC